MAVWTKQTVDSFFMLDEMVGHACQPTKSIVVDYLQSKGGMCVLYFLLNIPEFPTFTVTAGSIGLTTVFTVI